MLSDDGRAIGGSLFTPAEAGRRYRRDQTRQARAIEVDQRKSWMERRRAEIEELKAEQRSAGYLPAGGDKGPAASCSYRKLKVPPHRATSDVLAGAYPYLAEAGLGSDGVLIGTDSWSGAAFVIRPLGPLRTGSTDQPESALGRRHREGQVYVGQEPGHAF